MCNFVLKLIFYFKNEKLNARKTTKHAQDTINANSGVDDTSSQTVENNVRDIINGGALFNKSKTMFRTTFIADEYIRLCDHR